MQVYDLEIVNTRLKSYRLLTLLIVSIQVVYILLSLFDSTKKNNSLINLGFILLFILYRIWMSKKNNRGFYLNEWIFFLLMILWVDELMIAILNLLLFLQYSVSTQKIIYSFSKDRIKLKKFPFTTYKWNNLQNVILKDGVLTLDFTNNKLAQLIVQKSDIKEIEFNQFAKEQLRAT